MAACNDDVAQGSSTAGKFFLTYRRRKKVDSCLGIAACNNDVAQTSSRARGIFRTYRRREKLKNCLGMAVCNQGSLRYINTFQTYQRRKKLKCSSRSRSQEDGRDYVEAECQGTKQSSEQVHLPVNSVDDLPRNCWKNAVRDGLRSPSAIGCMPYCNYMSKYDCQDEDGYGDNSDRRTMSNETHKESYLIEVGVTSNGYLENSNHYTVIENVRSALSNILSSQSFTSLCHLFLENFQGVKADSLFDFSLINSRLKDGAYENSPTLFSSDMQQIWRKFQVIGTELTSLAEDLSAISVASYHEQVAVSVCNTFKDGKNEFHVSESDSLTNEAEQTTADNVYNNCTCRNCGEKADGRDYLVCDSCEQMYHLSCIEPFVKEVPFATWFCAICTEKSGIGSPHENCIVCEKLNSSRTLSNGTVKQNLPPNEEMLFQVEKETSNSIPGNGLEGFKENKTLFPCKICGYDLASESFKICTHALCPSKFYHARCLTINQLENYGSRWYCPSCLCRVCLSDRDSDKIVLCSRCDHGYHVYCTEPPRSSIPMGKWLCRKCDSESQRLRRLKRLYENLEIKR